MKNQETSKIFLGISQLKGSQKDWAKTAEAFASKDVSIMRQLLEHYRKEGKESDLYRIAKEAFSHFSGDMHEKILEAISPDKDEVFYIEVLAFNAQHTKSIEQYRKLQSYLTPEQRNTFIEKQETRMDFYVALLAEEQRYSAILEIVRKHDTFADSWSSATGNFDNMVAHILEVYPDESFQLIQGRVKKALVNGRGRHVYATVTKWMKRMLEIQGYEKHARHFIDKLAKEFNNFRALKDEIRKGGASY